MTTMRNVYVVAYDVRDAKRLRKTHEKMCGFGDPLQYSVFQCALTGAEKQLLISGLSEIIDHNADRILILDLGPQDGRATRATEVLGRQSLPPKSGPVVL